jgi:hypothetical protein
MNKIILNCPSCGGEMVTSELKCPQCDLRIKKDFALCEFCKLSDDDYEFLKVFLRTQGQITDIEKILNLSYPTIKTKIDTLLKNLNLSPLENHEDPLESLARGTLSVDEVVAILKQRRKK